MIDITGTMIIVWRFQDAPSRFRDLSNNGGDEDWVVFVPDGVEMDWLPSWLLSTDTCSEPQEHRVESGRIFIGSHA